MAFDFYKTDTIEFEHEGSTIVLTVKRLSATEELKISQRSMDIQRRLDNKKKKSEDTEDLLTEQIDLSNEIISYVTQKAEIVGGGSVDLTSKTTEQKKDFFDSLGLKFIDSAATAYFKSTIVDGEEEKK